MSSDDDDDGTDCTPGFALVGAMKLIQGHAEPREAEAPEVKRPRLLASSPLLPLDAEAAALPLEAAEAALPLEAEAAALPLEAEAAALPPCVVPERKSEDLKQRLPSSALAAAPRAAVPAKAPPARKKAAAADALAAATVVPRTLKECTVYFAPGLVVASERFFILGQRSKLGNIAESLGPGVTHIMMSFAAKVADDEAAKKRILKRLLQWELAATQALVVKFSWLDKSLRAGCLLPFGPSDLITRDSLAEQRAPAAPQPAPQLPFRRGPNPEKYACQPHLQKSAEVIDANAKISLIFRELAEIYAVLGKDGDEKTDYFRGRAFDMAARKISELDIALRTPKDAIRARDTKLLVMEENSSCFEALIEILEEEERCAGMRASGFTDVQPCLPERLRKLYADPIVTGTRELCTVFGIGSVEARNLWMRNIRSVADLRSRVAAGAVGELKLNASVLVGLPFHEDIQHRIPRAEVLVFCSIVRQHAEHLAPGVSVQAVGSCRRGAATSGDVDILITHSDDETGRSLKNQLLKSLMAVGVISAELAGGSSKMDDLRKQEKDGCGAWSHSFMGIGKLPESLAPPELPRPLLHRRVDIKIYAKVHEPFALLYFTGSERFNRSMRHFAKHLKPPRSLSDKGLVPCSDSRAGSMHASYAASLKAETEEDVFRALGLDYVAPEDRNVIDRVPFMKM